MPAIRDMLSVKKGSPEYHELVAQVMRELPKFLIMRCKHCKRDVRVDTVDIVKRIDRDALPVVGNMNGSRVVLEGPCTRCGRLVSEDITTSERMTKVAQRTQEFWERKESRRRDKTTMAKTAKAKTSKKAVKAEEQTKKVKATKADAKAAKTNKTSTKKEKAKSSNGDRQKVYVRSEGQPTQQQAMIMAAGGDMYTPEQLNERYSKLEKKGLVGKRNRPINTSDLTFMTGPRVGGVEIDGKEYEMYLARKDGATVYFSTYRDLLGSKKPLKVQNNKVGKVAVAKNKKDLPS